jgi:hypothetical protein
MIMTGHGHFWDGGRAARVQAVAALALGAAVLALGVLAALTEFPRGLTVLACVAVAQFAMLFGLSHRGVVGFLGLVVAVAPSIRIPSSASSGQGVASPARR